LADLSPAALPTLAALLNATVFSSGFLSTRVHRERGRALDRVAAIDSRFTQDTGEPRQDPFRAVEYVAGLDEQRQLIRETRSDKLAVVLACVNLSIALLVVALAYVFGADANLKLANEPAVWALSVFAIVALLVAVVGGRRRMARSGRTWPPVAPDGDGAALLGDAAASLRHPAGRVVRQAR
jgi:hypothetical protein